MLLRFNKGQNENVPFDGSPIERDGRWLAAVADKIGWHHEEQCYVSGFE